jgi:hypothetical protein
MFGIDNRPSYHDIKVSLRFFTKLLMFKQTKWYPEVTRHVPKAMLIVVGVDMDVRQDCEYLLELKLRNMEPVTPVTIPSSLSST